MPGEERLGPRPGRRPPAGGRSPDQRNSLSAAHHGRMNTAWTVRVLIAETAPSQFQVRPKSARLMRTSASSQISPSLWTDATASEG